MLSWWDILSQVTTLVNLTDLCWLDWILLGRSADEIDISWTHVTNVCTKCDTSIELNRLIDLNKISTVDHVHSDHLCPTIFIGILLFPLSGSCSIRKPSKALSLMTSWKIKMMVVVMMEINIHRVYLLLLGRLTFPATLLRSHRHIWRSVHIELLRIFILDFLPLRHLVWRLRLSILIQILVIESLMNIWLAHNMYFWSSWNCWTRIRIDRTNSCIRAPSILNHLLNFLLFRSIYSVLLGHMHNGGIRFLWKSWSFRSYCLHLHFFWFQTIMSMHRI